MTACQGSAPTVVTPDEAQALAWRRARGLLTLRDLADEHRRQHWCRPGLLAALPTDRLEEQIRASDHFASHHAAKVDTGKANARAATLDQYSGRGGSALADGSRMTFVLQAWNPDDEGHLRPPPGCKPDPESSLMILARAKLSYERHSLPNNAPPYRERKNGALRRVRFFPHVPQRAGTARRVAARLA